MTNVIASDEHLENMSLKVVAVSTAKSINDGTWKATGYEKSIFIRYLVLYYPFRNSDLLERLEIATLAAIVEDLNKKN